MSSVRANEIIRTLVAAACRVVDAAEDTDDGMVEIKWDEFIPLRDAVANLREGT
jgi:hypothetical protein